LDLNSLIEQCIQRKPQAERSLWDYFAPDVWGVALRYCSNETEAEEVLQLSMVKIYTHLDKLKQSEQKLAWVKRLAINTALTHLRLNKKFRLESGLEDLDEPVQESDVLSKLSADDWIKLLKQLPEPQQSVVNLFAIDGYSHREIAEMLGISEASSRVIYYRARQELMKWAQSRLDYGKRRTEIAAKP